MLSRVINKIYYLITINEFNTFTYFIFSKYICDLISFINSLESIGLLDLP